MRITESESPLVVVEQGTQINLQTIRSHMRTHEDHTTSSRFVRFVANWAVKKSKRLRPMMFFEVSPGCKILSGAAPRRTRRTLIGKDCKGIRLHRTRPGARHE